MHFRGCQKENGVGLQKEEIRFNWWKLQGNFITDKMQRQRLYTGLYFFHFGYEMLCILYSVRSVWFQMVSYSREGAKNVLPDNVIMTLKFIYNKYLQVTIIKIYQETAG